MTPEALRRRMAHGNIYGPDKVDAALGNYFRLGNLGRPPRARPALARRPGRRLPPGVPGAHGIMRRGRRGAGGRRRHRRARRRPPHPPRRPGRQRAQGDLLGVHVSADDGLRRQHSGTLLEPTARLLATRRHLPRGRRERRGPGAPIPSSPRSEHATQLVIGAKHRTEPVGRAHRAVRSSTPRSARPARHSMCT